MCLGLQLDPAKVETIPILVYQDSPINIGGCVILEKIAWWVLRLL